MERGSSTHGARHDDALADELRGNLGPGGSNREEWNDPEPPADDDEPDPPNQDELEMQRVQRDIELTDGAENP